MLPICHSCERVFERMQESKKIVFESIRMRDSGIYSKTHKTGMTNLTGWSKFYKTEMTDYVRSRRLIQTEMTGFIGKAIMCIV